MDYTELVNNLRNRRVCIQSTGGLEDYPLLTKAADAIEKLQAEVRDWYLAYMDLLPTRWISVEECLPEERDRYLTVSNEPWFGTTVVDTMRWNGTWMYDGRPTDATVTHWMPLPEPPKEETE